MDLTPLTFPTRATGSQPRIDLLATHPPEPHQSLSTSDTTLKVEQNAGATLDPKSFGMRIRTLLPTLTALEARVVSVLLNWGTFNDEILLKWVANEAHVSEAMVVKVARKLGFSGFRSLRAALVEYIRLPAAEVREELAASDSATGIIEKVFRASIKALQQTLEVISYEAVKDAASYLYLARHRDFYGAGGSAQVARDAAYKFLRIGIRASVFDDSHMMLMSAWLLEKSDVVVAFSHSGQSMVVIE
jgi:DNA-binding MurR/RpiR family transcriptional regulator